MFSKEIINLLVKVVSSWQVIAATIALLIYLKLVLYVANAHRARNFDLAPKAKPRKVRTAKAAASKASYGTDELGIEEQ